MESIEKKHRLEGAHQVHNSPSNPWAPSPGKRPRQRRTLLRSSPAAARTCATPRLAHHPPPGPRPTPTAASDGAENHRSAPCSLSGAAICSAAPRRRPGRRALPRRALPAPRPPRARRTQAAASARAAVAPPLSDSAAPHSGRCFYACRCGSAPHG